MTGGNDARLDPRDVWYRCQMSQFEYLAALISIVIAFGLSQLLMAWGRLLRERARVRGYWVFTAWSCMIAFFMILFWWELWQYRFLEEWSLLSLVWTIVNAMFIVLSAHLLVPSFDPPETIDLRAHYYQTAPLFFTITALGMLSVAVSDLLFDPVSVHWTETASRLAWLPFAAWATRSSDPRLHSAITVAALVLYVAFLTSIQLR